MNNKDYVIVKDGEMVHFKYIKREKVNGEWRYYYDKGSIGRSIKKAVGIDARNAYRSANAEAVAAEAARKEAHENMIKESTDARSVAKEPELVRQEIPAHPKPTLEMAPGPLKDLQDRHTEAAKASAAAQAKFDDAKNQMDKAKAEYESVDDTKVKEANARLTESKRLAGEARAEYNRLKTELGPAAQRNERAKKALDEALTKYNSYTNVVKNCETAVVEAEAEYEKARTVAKNKYDSCRQVAEKYVKVLAEAKKRAKETESVYSAAYKKSQAAKSQYEQELKAYNAGLNKYKAYSKVADKQAKEAADASRKNSAAAQKSSDAQMAAQEALKKYYKTPLGSLKFLSDKGKELLYKIF